MPVHWALHVLGGVLQVHLQQYRKKEEKNVTTMAEIAHTNGNTLVI
jgi:hypothetical protein